VVELLAAGCRNHEIARRLEHVRRDRPQPRLPSAAQAAGPRPHRGRLKAREAGIAHRPDQPHDRSQGAPARRHQRKSGHSWLLGCCPQDTSRRVVRRVPRASGSTIQKPIETRI
jgi:hypothetical protein